MLSREPWALLRGCSGGDSLGECGPGEQGSPALQPRGQSSSIRPLAERGAEVKTVSPRQRSSQSGPCYLRRAWGRSWRKGEKVW